ncbi:hypothetical protein V6N11_043771 [Hibiscus sabdariffa]|uniref:Endonuclease/exonuclease/phosphatase domain-containing protein n=1 Tax=Hibiscus sabdariffa TaxID=183260 RepID=A0ABR2RDC0_9ROSI
MACLLWNCRGIGSSNTIRALRNYIAKHDPNIVFLMETKQKKSKLNRIRNIFLFSEDFYVDPIGKSGGLALWWKEGVNITILSATKNYIDTSISIDGGLQWFCTFIYGCPNSEGKKEVWNTISKLRKGDEEPWCLMGDSNVITSQDEKIGGSPFVARSDDPSRHS